MKVKGGRGDLAGSLMFFKFPVATLIDVQVSYYEKKNLYTDLSEHQTQIPLSRVLCLAMRTLRHLV
jgi:hypothetical protein